MPDTLSWPANSPSYSTANGRPDPLRALARSERMLARVSKASGPVGLVASHWRSQPRLTASSRSSERASFRRIGRIVTGPSLSVGIAIDVGGEGHHEAAQPLAEVRAEVVAAARELHDRLEVVEPVAGVVATSAEHDAVHPARRLRSGGEGLQRVGQLDLAALAGRRVLEHLENLGAQHVAADHREVRGGRAGGRLLDEAGDA